MKLTFALLIAGISSTRAFTPSLFGSTKAYSTSLDAKLRPATEKSQELRFGWDGSQARGGAIDDSKPARMLDVIREAGETIPDECEVFNANLEMSPDDITFEEVIEIIDTHYEYGLIEFKNGDIVNKQG